VRHARLVRDLGDVLVAILAMALAVHALAELVALDVQRTRLAFRVRGGEVLVAVAAEAHGVVEDLVGIGGPGGAGKQQDYCRE
jgi:hypothetical protein